MDLHINPFEHSRQIVGDLGIPEANNTISLLLEPKLPLAIALGGFIFIMMTPVEFDDQASGRTKEVRDIGTDRSLPPKMGAFYRQFFQRAP